MQSTCFGHVCVCRYSFSALLVKWEVARFLFFILILCSYFAFERTTHWARRREILFGILMGFSWENCPQNRPLHRCLCFRSAVLRVREGVRYNPVWRNLKYTSNFCFDVSLRTLEVERFFFFPPHRVLLLLHNKKHRNGCIYYVKFLRLNFITVINKKTLTEMSWPLAREGLGLVWAWKEVTLVFITGAA